MKFKQFGIAIGKQFQRMAQAGLFRVKFASDPDPDAPPAPKSDERGPERDHGPLWNKYLSSFPAEINQVYKTRTEHDCSCCRSFVKKVGGLVAFVDGKLETVWDARVDGGYEVVCAAMRDLVIETARRDGISNLFLHDEPTVGPKNGLTHTLLPDKTTLSFDHFAVTLDASIVKPRALIGKALGEYKSTYDVLARGLKEIPIDITDQVLELIGQNSIYRGAESKAVLEEYRKLQVSFAAKKAGESREATDAFCWPRVRTQSQGLLRLRNTAIGTLLVDLSEGMDLEAAVTSFEKKMDARNYKRPTALVSKKQVADAEAKIEELGLMSALDRRYATLNDITVNNVLFADRQAKKSMSIFGEIADKIPENPKGFDRVEEIGIDAFLANVLPGAKELEVFVENRHSSKFVSLITAADPTARKLFKWNNHFSWSYTGDLTDSLKDKVKEAGGKVDGDFRASIEWWNNDDLDLYLKMPNGESINYMTWRTGMKGHRQGQGVHPKTGGTIDVDANGLDGLVPSRLPVENIVFPDKNKMLEGEYVLSVNQYDRRETIDVGFAAEIEFDGKLYRFEHPAAVAQKQNVMVARFTYSRKDGLKIVESLESKAKDAPGKQVWGIQTQTFRKVNVVALSPNYWDDQTVGNKHWMLFLDGCAREDKARGFYNEFIGHELEPHRKVLEIVGSKMKTDQAQAQLSGLGFSSTQRDHFLVRVRGATVRVLKVMV